MTDATYRKWMRDALEVKHQFKHESYNAAFLLKQYANRILALVEELRALKNT